MGIERARVVEVRGRGPERSGYVIGDRLVLTCGIVGPQDSADVRPVGTARWATACLAWSSAAGDAVVLELDDPAALLPPPELPRWGRLAGRRPVAVAGLGLAPPGVPIGGVRDAQPFFGTVEPAAAHPSLVVTAGGNGRPTVDMSGAALFAGAELVGVLVVETAALRAVPISAMAEDDAFVRLVGDAAGFVLAPVSTPSGFPIL